jgi:hypothetical protein
VEIDIDTLSATGSRNIPKFETILNFLARNPSSMSVKHDTMNINDEIDFYILF